MVFLYALRVSGDHPRMCGEHFVAKVFDSCWLGSSPHVRGARTAVCWFGLSTGIIPACAGSTIWLTRAPNTARDHPRMCGEHIVADTPQGAQPGSSPHVRGALILADGGERL